VYSLGPSDFIEIAFNGKKEGNGRIPVIPLYKEIIADTYTPVSAFMKIGLGPNTFLLESVEGGEKVGRYSFIGIKPSRIFKAYGNQMYITGHEPLKGDPLGILKDYMDRFHVLGAKGLPGFFGGLVGYAGFDIFKEREELSQIPDAIFMLCDKVLIFDHLTCSMKILCCVVVDGDPLAIYKRAVTEIEDIEERLGQDIDYSRVHGAQEDVEYRADTSKEEFEEMVKKAQEYIKARYVSQVVLSQRFRTKINGPPFELYRALRRINPSPYMFYLDFGPLKLVGSSPETLIKVEEGKVQLKPIAGTRPRGEDLEDRKLEEELLRDEKERAEHAILVDSGLDEMKAICKPGTVKINELMNVERYSHVMHMVSSIVGQLDDNKDAFCAFRSAFPAGTVSGMPKERAMEIIDELEDQERGPYGGAVGYFSLMGNMDMCIAIRSFIIRGDEVLIQAGAGIVADSVPEKEYLETLHKAKALLKALRMSEENFAKGGDCL
jgi:anthranilate synthase component 1